MRNNSSSLTNSPVNHQSDCTEISVYNTLSLLQTVVQFLLTVPLALYVLFLGFQRWKPQRSFDNTSHSDVFTFNMALNLLLGNLGSVLYHFGNAVSSERFTRAGDYIFESHLIAEVLFHCLTCVDRYLAIIHPIFYLKLKQRLGVVVRNVSIGILWFLYFGYMGLQNHYYPVYPSREFLALLFAVFVVVLFCSVSMLLALLRPAPGDKARHKMDQSKLKAFQMVMVITVTVLIWVVGVSVSTFADIASGYNSVLSCLLFEAVLWLSVPCRLVLPVLYLHRVGKLSCTIRK